MTKDGTPVIGWIAVILGQIMEWIFDLLNLIGIPNIGLAIIIFTIVVYMLMLPLTIKQQKFSKLSSKMNPELQAIQKKYKDRKDNDSMMAMQNETTKHIIQTFRKLSPNAIRLAAELDCQGISAKETIEKCRK